MFRKLAFRVLNVDFDGFFKCLLQLTIMFSLPTLCVILFHFKNGDY